MVLSLQSHIVLFSTWEWSAINREAKKERQTRRKLLNTQMRTTCAQPEDQNGTTHTCWVLPCPGHLLTAGPAVRKFWGLCCGAHFKGVWPPKTLRHWHPPPSRLLLFESFRLWRHPPWYLWAPGFGVRDDTGEEEGRADSFLIYNFTFLTNICGVAPTETLFFHMFSQIQMHFIYLWCDKTHLTFTGELSFQHLGIFL